MLGRSDEAEDATQEALIRAWKARSSLRHVDQFQAWFDRILVNVCRDRLRRQRRVVVIPVDGLPAAAADPFIRLLDSDELGRALAAIDADARVLLVLRFWADLQVDEIAARLGIPSGTVKSRLHRAIHNVSEKLTSQREREETT